MIEDLLIIGNTDIWSVLTASYTWTWTNPEWDSEYQWYVDGVAIQWANWQTFQALEWWTYVVAVLPVDNQWNEWEIEYSDEFVVQEKIDEPIEKEYIVKAYDKNFTFKKVIPASIITNDITYTETKNSWQWQLVLNLNLPIDTDYLDDIKYIKVFVNSNNWLEDELLYTWYLSKYSRLFSNNKENVQATFLSLFSLLSEVYYKNSNWDDEFTIEWIEPATFIKDVIDYFNQSYSWIITYTNDSIVNYWSLINIECKWNKCSDLLMNIVNWLTYYLYVWADGVVQFKPKPSTITHEFTYEKDITALTVPQDFEQVVNAVRVQYWYIWWPHTWITDRAENQESIAKFGRKEETVVNTSIYGNDSAVIYRDSILNKYAEWKQNIRMTVNNRYLIESIHPWDTIKIRNIWLDISWLQVNSITYQYEQVQISLEYQTTLAEQIFQ